MKELRMNMQVFYLALVKCIGLAKNPVKKWIEETIVMLSLLVIGYIMACILYQIKLPIPILFD